MKYITCFCLLLGVTFLQAQQPASVVLGMVLLEEFNGFKPDAMVAELRAKWKLDVVYESGETSSVAISVDGYTVALAPIPLPVPEQEIRSTAEYNYFWTNGAQEASAHRGHVIVSLLGAGKNPVEENLLFSKVVAAVLNTSPSVGVYMGSRTLLMKKAFYMTNKNPWTKEIWVYDYRTNIGNPFFNAQQYLFRKKVLSKVNSSYTLFKEIIDLSGYFSK